MGLITGLVKTSVKKSFAESRAAANKQNNVVKFEATKPQTEQQKPKSLNQCLGFILKMNDYQLSQLEIHSDGEYHKLASAKDALDVMNRVKAALKAKGFGIYALHNALWIVPFVHPELPTMPDFQRAFAVLPNNQIELSKLFVKEEPKKGFFGKLFG